MLLFFACRHARENHGRDILSGGTRRRPAQHTGQTGSGEESSWREPINRCDRLRERSPFLGSEFQPPSRDTPSPSDSASEDEVDAAYENILSGHQAMGQVRGTPRETRVSARASRIRAHAQNEPAAQPLVASGQRGGEAERDGITGESHEMDSGMNDATAGAHTMGEDMNERGEEDEESEEEQDSPANRSEEEGMSSQN